MSGMNRRAVMMGAALTGLASVDLTAQVTREAEVNARLATFLGPER